MNLVKLEMQLASEAQMSELGSVIAGGPSGVAFRGRSTYARIYGGQEADWVKMRSSSYLTRNGVRFETHWVENAVTGQRLDFKTKVGP